jgi:DNA-binding transcriptional LysR family regulator
MYNLQDLETFVAIARSGSLTAAANQLGISTATTSHRISKLEGVLNLVLFYRNSRNLSLTAEGEVFLERIEQILMDLKQAEIDAGSCSVRGHLRVTISPWVLNRYLLPKLSEFLDGHSGLTVEFQPIDRFVPLVEERQDCAIRVGQLSDSALVARKICDNERIICAAPTLIEKIGNPATVPEIIAAPWVCLPWQTKIEFTNTKKEVQTVSTQRPVLLSHSDSLTEAAKQGLGLAIKSKLAIEQELKSGQLIEVKLDQLKPSQAPVWFVTTSDGKNSPKIKAFRDFVFSVLEF